MIYGNFLIIVFSFWLLFTIINQFNGKVAKRLKKADIFNLIPKWTFFAPNPATTDLHLLYRELSVDGKPTKFKEVPLLSRNHFVSAFWNPNKRIKKSLQDLVRGLSASCSDGRINEKNIKFSFNYIAILNFLTKLPKLPNVSRVQFVIFKSSGYKIIEKPQLILLSDFHNV